MENPRWEWWRRHGPTAFLLGTAFGVAFLVRTLWMFPLVQQFGSLNLFGGGSDSFYHFRVAYYVAQNHTNLIVDQLLKYPNGAINPREPLFDWMNGILGLLFAPFFGGDLRASTAFFLELQGPLWASLGVFPVFLIGREISDRRVGIIGALLYAVSVANIDSSSFGYSNYLAFYTFFILLTVFGYLRTIRAAGTRRWVVRYSKPREILAGLRGFFRTERRAVKWAVFTGVSFGALALAWQGFSFVVATIVIFMIFALLVERIRRVDSFGLYISTWIVGLVGFPMAMPYFLAQGLILNWFGLPLLVFAGGLLVALTLVVLRDQPWIFSIPVFLLVGAGAILSLDFINHAQFVNIITGQGYFVKTLVYSTVAEAQAPSIDALILGYGVITFFVAFVGLALWIYRMIRGRFPRVLMMSVVFAVISIYLPISAAKFFFLGSAAFALLPGEAIVRAIEIAEFPKLRRTVAQLSDRRSQLAAFRRAFKPRHVLIPLAVVGLMLPNIWYAIDAGIPYNSKSSYNQQVFGSLPSFLQTSPSNASSFYLGAAGTQLDTPPQYDEAGYNWLASLDQNLSPPQRPAFVSWWDYGFQAIAEGQHPSVADNFQNGIVPAGNFLLSQNESLAIGILATTLLTAEQQSSGQPNLPPSLNALLARDGVNVPLLHTLLTDSAYDMHLVLAHPDRYLPVDPSHLDGPNALYLTVSWELASTRTTQGMAQLYNDLQSYTHWTIRYAMVDNRLFPFSGRSTGIFYAPADLTDRVISSGGLPTTFFSVAITGTDGNTYPYGQLPPGVQPSDYPISYYPPFYRSMIYKIFAGYNGTDIGQGNGIPEVSGALSQSPPMPGWMMQHFQLVYRTAYYCPFPNPGAHPGCERAMNLPVANQLAKANNGSVSAAMANYANSGGEMILAYYPGQPMTGTVALADGTPVKGVRVTVYDSFHIPHMTAVTGTNGVYSLMLPPGNDTVNVTVGSFDPLHQADTTVLQSRNLLVAPEFGYGLAAPTLVQPIILKPGTVTGLSYLNTAENSTYVPSVDPAAAGATAILWGSGGVYRTTVDPSGAYRIEHVAPGQYNISTIYRGYNYTNRTPGPVYVQPGVVKNWSLPLGPATLKGVVRNPNGTPSVGARVEVRSPVGPNANATTDSSGNYTIAGLVPGNLTMSATSSDGSYRTSPIALTSVNPGGKVEQNLTLESFASVSLPILSGGNPVSGFAVRFTPIVPFPLVNTSTPGAPGGVGPGPGPNGSQGPPNPGPTNASRAAPGPNLNATVLISGPDGVVNGAIPVGNYSVYGLGLVGDRWAAGVSLATLGPGSNSLPPLTVSPAVRLSGSIPVQNGGAGQTVQVLVYNDAGQYAWTYTNATDDWGISLPTGHYSVLAVQSPSTGHPIAYAQLATVDLSTNTRLSISMLPGILFRPLVGVSSVGALAPVPGARLSLEIPSLGVRLAASANETGNVTFWLPATIARGGTFCLNASAPGYAPQSTCRLTPQSLSGYSRIELVPTNVSVSITATGLPSGGTATLNLTGGLGTGPSRSITIGASSTISVVPGSYRITGWSPAPSGTPGLFQLFPSRNLTIPVGGPATSLALTFVHELNASGLLQLPPGLLATNVSVRLVSGPFDRTLTGTAYTGHFLAPSGSYTVLATGNAKEAYAALTTVNLNGTGIADRPIDLTRNATTLTLNLTSPGAALSGATIPGVLTATGGIRLPISFVQGRWVSLFPVGLRFSVSVDTVQMVETGSGPRFEHLTVAVFAPPCFPAPPSTVCPVPLVGTAIASGLSGTLAIPGFPSAVSGMVELVGPEPLRNRTFVPSGPGGFSVDLAPGRYLLYAHSVEGSSVYANLSEVTVGPNRSAPIAVALASAWTDTVTITGPSGIGTADTTLQVTRSDGLSFGFPNVAVGSPTPVVLPAGSYRFNATVSGRPYGAPTNATGSAGASLFQGNAATGLSLAWQFHRTVRFSVPLSAIHLGNGGTAKVAFSVTNTGNAPFSVRFVGSPSTYNFTFAPANATLGLSPENNSASGTVTIVVPVGSPVAHPPLQFEAIVVGPEGAVAGFANPAPSLNLTAQYGLLAGVGSPGTAQTGPFNVSLPFFLRNTGNAVESVRLTLEDAVRLAGIGWTSHFSSGNSVVSGPATVDAGANSSYTLALVADTPGALAPGSLTVVATVLNTSGALRSSVVLTVPSVAVSFSKTGLHVLGPSLGSPPAYPEWLVPVLCFVPALAFLGVVASYRWYRTRRWSRR